MKKLLAILAILRTTLAIVLAVKPIVMAILVLLF